MMRKNFDSQLSELHDELVVMGELCEKAIATAIAPLAKRNEDTKNIKLSDFEINEKEREIEQLCMRLLMQQQPVARDLREISSALKMVSDMERIGDQACDIADIAVHIIDKAPEPEEANLRKMAKEAAKMVNDSVDSFVARDVELARKVIEYDDVVDKWFYEVKNELIHKIAADSLNGEYYVDLLMIAKYLERVGDHATNIAEWVEYSITGKHRKNKHQTLSGGYL